MRVSAAAYCIPFLVVAFTGLCERFFLTADAFSPSRHISIHHHHRPAGSTSKEEIPSAWFHSKKKYNALDKRISSTLQFLMPSSNNVDESNNNYKDKLAKLDEAIVKANKEREQILRQELNKNNYSSSKKPLTLGWIGDNGEMLLDDNHHQDELGDESWTHPLQLPLRFPVDEESSLSAPSSSSSSLMSPVQRRRQKREKRPQESFTTRSHISHSDAGTLVVEITPQGITTGVVFNGVFSVAWFSVIVPATLTALSGGLFGAALFMLPFWAAGGMVAKQAAVDPFVSNKLTLGEYAWSVEKQFVGSSSADNKRSGRTIQQHEGATQDLQGAQVEVSVIINDVPQYHLCLHGKKGVTNLGLGLPEEELEKVAVEINDFLEGLSSDSEGEGAGESGSGDQRFLGKFIGQQ